MCLYKAIRQEKIIEAIEKNNTLSVNELALIFNTSVMTIRRDLNELMEQGVVKRIHGGAVLLQKDISQPAFYERNQENRNYKNKIAEVAIKLIKTDSIVFFDAGTTTYAIAEQIPEDYKFSAITNGILTAVALCKKPNVNVISIGGDLHKSSYSTIDNMAVDNIKRLRADVAFISTKAIKLPYGTYESKFSLIDVKKAIVSVSDQIILVADASKFEVHSLSLAIQLKDIHTIITDDRIKPNIHQELIKSGKKIIIA